MSEGASVKVAVRVRPFNQREIDKKSKLCIAMPSRETTIINQPETDAPKTFTFDFSYWSHDGSKKDEKTGQNVPDGPDSRYASQQIVFEDLGKLVLDNAFDGFNCSLFAYGQTGSGKSYSMVGYGADKGIIPMVCDKMFHRTAEVAKAETNTSFQVTVTMLEIYNEQVRDLLNTKNLNQKEGLKVREKKGIGVYVEGLTPRPVANYAEIEARMEEGTKNRTIGSTKMNATSSRAHTVFGILFTRKAKDPGSGVEAETTSKINLVDLAGSERADSTGATGDRLKEGCAINQSLSALGNVISTLADNAGNPKNQKFVPYRNSVLTRLLQDALGGNSKTIMIAALSPADVNYDETLSTLRYADRAKKIKNSVVKNENPTDRIIRLLKEENERLKKLLEGKGIDMNQALAGAGGGGGGGDVEAMKKKWEEEKKENDRMIADMKKSWEDKVREAQASAKNNSSSADTETTAILAKNAAASRLPHIVLLNEDPQLSGNLVYMFKIGLTKIGKRHSDGAAERQDIELSGLNVQKQHAVVENDAASKVTIEPLNKSRSFVNGNLIKAKTELKHGDRLILGNNQHVFKFVNPIDPSYKEDDSTATSEDEYHEVMKQFAERQGLNKSSMSAEVQKLEEEEKKTRRELEDKLKTMEDMLRKEREAAKKEMDSVRSVFLKKGANLSEADKASLQKLEQEFNDKVGKSDAQLKERKEMEQQMLQEQLKRKRENQKVESQLGSLIPLVNEVNQMAEEMQKQVRFEAKLIIKPTATINFSTLDEIQHLKKIDVVVRVHSLANGNVWTWLMEKFENRLFMMRDLYQQFQDFGPQDIAPQKDPFWDPPEAIEIGKAYVYLKALSQLVEIENEFAIIDHAGEERGWLRVEINPEGLAGEEKEYLGSSDELIDKSVVFNVKVPFARGLPAKYSNDVHVVFKFNGEVCETEPCESKTSDPKWKYSAKIKLEKVDQKHIKYLLTEACVFEIRGFTDNSKGTAGATGALVKAASGTAAAGAAASTATAGPPAPAQCPICEERPCAIQCTDCEEKKQFYCATCWPVHHKSAAKKVHKHHEIGGTAAAPAAAAAAPAPSTKDVKSAPAAAAAAVASPPPKGNSALLCDWCSENRPTVTCVECNSAFCDTCNGVKHKSKTTQAHNRQPFVSPMSVTQTPMSPAPAAGGGLCQNCEEHASTIACDGCDGKKFCDTCWAANHKSAAKKAHPKRAL